MNKLPKVSGGGQVYLTNDLNKVLISAEDEAKAMGDEYVSVEHLFLCLLREPNRALKELFRLYAIDRNSFLQALSTVRGNQRVVSDNPEATYDTLNKYGYRSGGAGQGPEAGPGHRPGCGDPECGPDPVQKDKE